MYITRCVCDIYVYMYYIYIYINNFIMISLLYNYINHVHSHVGTSWLCRYSLK